MLKIPPEASLKVAVNSEVVAVILRKSIKSKVKKEKIVSVVRNEPWYLRAFWWYYTQVIIIEKVRAESSYCGYNNLCLKVFKC